MKRILAIDDEPRWGQFLKDKFGAVVEVDCEGGLQKLSEEGPFDTVVVNSNNLSCVERIKSNHPEQRVVVATSLPNAREAIKAYRAGTDDYFPKDFRIEEFKG